MADSTQEGEDCITKNNVAGTCDSSGECIPNQTCSSSGPCEDNSTVCLGYYCSMADGSINNGSYTPGPGSVKSLGTPHSPKDGYLASPYYDETWDGAVNYCDALKKAIDAGISGYSDLSLSHGRLASVPVGCHVNSYCSSLPQGHFNWYFDWYWLNQLCADFDDSLTTCDPTDNPDSPSALFASSNEDIGPDYIFHPGWIYSVHRGSTAMAALCE